MKLSLLLPALLLPSTASAFFWNRGTVDDSPSDDFSGDSIEVSIISTNSDLDQFRIVTKPRPGYDPSTDKVEMYEKYGSCVGSDEILDGDDTPKVSADCCWNTRNFHIWPEKQNVEVGSDYNLDYTYGGGGQCSSSSDSKKKVAVDPGMYNSYMVQVYSKNWWSTTYERVIRFPK
eukprot:scaffold5322_cov88-Cylindrotheca_fusiformis.AAC.4